MRQSVAEKWMESMEPRRLLAAGDLDPTYGVDGLNWLKLGSVNGADTLKSQTYATTQQADGKVVIAGRFINYYNEESLGVLRLNADGTPDTTFGEFGIATLARGYSTYATDILIQPDGKIVIAGSGWNNSVEHEHDFFAWRLNSTGTADTDFGTNGVATADPGGDGFYSEDQTGPMALTAGGQILIGGTSYTGASRDVVVRFTSDGQLDDTFGTGGVAIDGYGYGTGVDGLVVQPDGRFMTLSVGYRDGINLAPQFARYTANGTLDTTFGTNGRLLDNTAAGVNPSDLIADPATGQLYVLGTATGRISSTANGGTTRLLRYSATGVRDTGFGSGGDAWIADGSGAADLTFTADGGLVVGATSDPDGGFGGNWTVARLLPNGELDPTFAANGRRTIALTPNSEINSVLVQADGSLLAVGFANQINGKQRIGLARLLGGPLPTNPPARGTAVLSGSTFNDTNGNGQRDGESGRPYMPVWGTIFGSANTVIGRIQTTTTANGSFTLSNLPAGRVELYTAFNGNVIRVSTPLPLTGNLTAGQTLANMNLGFSSASTVVGVVYNDLNGNGTRDTGEPGLANRTISYTNAQNGSTITTFSAADGSYRIDGLTGYSYTLRQGVPSGWTATQPTSSYSFSTTIPSVYTFNFGSRQTPVGVISGVVYNDANANGAKDTGEVAVAGDTLYLDTNNNGLRDGQEPNVTATTNGYTFTGLAAGTYVVRRLPTTDGRRQTAPYASNAPSALTITLTTGQTAVDQNFGTTAVRPNAMIGGAGTVVEGSAITLDGSASSEAFGTIAGYVWDFNYDGATFDMDASGAKPVFDAGQIDGPATRTVALRVTDANGLTSLVATKTISITNVAPTAEFGGTRVGEAGQPLAFGWGNPVDPGVGDGVGRKFGYDYNNDGDFTDSGEANDARPSAGYVFTTPGTYTVHGRVTDKDGAFTDYYTTVAIYPPKPATQPATTLEGETGTFAGGTAKGSGNAGYTGTGYADFGGQNSSAQWSLTRTTAGAATVTFRYANGGAANRPLSVLVNGTTVGSVACVPTGSWTSWSTVSIDVNLAAGANTLKAVATSTSGGGNVDNLTLTPPPVTAPAWLSPGDAVWWLTNNTLVIQSGNATLLADAGLANPGLSIILAGGTLTSNTSQHLATLGIGSGQFLMPAAGGKVLRVTALAGFGIDLRDNDLILDYAGTSPVDEVTRWLRNGSITTAAARPRKGTAAATPPRVLGYTTGAAYLADGNSTFGGEPIDATSFLIKSTFAGDATLDGHVDFNDFLRLQNNFGKTNALFTEGDFDSDGLVSFNDFLVLQNNFGVA